MRIDESLRGDTSRAVNLLCDAAHDIAKDKGFYDHDVSLPEKLALIHAEVSEALEVLRSGEPAQRDKHLPEYGAFEVELADVVIRVLDLAAYKNIPLGDVIVSKILYNASRQRKHGKAF
jgi:NTP pyrophosphatase (non-canonical NTP hydrolase)